MTQPGPQLLPGSLDLIDLALRIQASTNDVLNVTAGSPYPAAGALAARLRTA